MKKIIASAVGLMMVGGVASTASAALENQFGGYWRTRFTFEDNFTGKDTDSKFYVDNRTRLYYTAKFSDDFKFVNKFEMNGGWGDTTKTAAADAGLGAGGDFGADGKGNFRVKQSYADFNVGPMVNAKVGIQGFVVARGFILDDDAAGVTATIKAGNVTVPLVWIRASDNDVAGWDIATSAKFNQDILAALAAVKINDGMSVTPYFVYHKISDHPTIREFDNWYLGADADLKFGDVKVWGTAIYNGGSIGDVDNKGYLGAVGVNAGLVHGQFFYASGDDNGSDNTAFLSAPALGARGTSAGHGSSYYWSEIMGLGVFDNSVSAGSPGDDITNIWAGNVGVTIKPMDKLTIDADVWYAELAEENAAGDTDLGVELDAKVGYKLYDNLTAEAIFAYLISGDATGDEDVIEGGVRLSLSF